MKRRRVCFTVPARGFKQRVKETDGDTEHSCWQQPEDMTKSRQAFRVDPQHLDLATETAPTFCVDPQHPDRATAHTGASPISSSYTPRHARKDNILTGKSRMWEGSWREQEETF
uniref:Endoglucanase n=1 Tax=Oryza glumipatula TaxID=40148 RepID=A0A0D9ZVP9_9ORYZ